MPWATIMAIAVPIIKLALEVFFDVASKPDTMEDSSGGGSVRDAFWDKLHRQHKDGVR